MTWPEAFAEAVKYASMASIVIMVWYFATRT